MAKTSEQKREQEKQLFIMEKDSISRALMPSASWTDCLKNMLIFQANT